MLTTSLDYLVYFLLWLALFPPLPPLKNLGIPEQHHVKAIRQKASKSFFSKHWRDSETSKECHKNRQMLWLCVILPPTLAHTEKSTTLTHTHRQTDKQPHVVELSHTFTENELKTNTRNSLTFCPTRLALNITSLYTLLVPSRASSY